MGHSRPVFRIFNRHSDFVHYNILPMTGFEPRISGIGSDRSAICATTTAMGTRVHWYLEGIQWKTQTNELWTGINPNL